MTGGGSAWHCLRKFNFGLFGPEQDGRNLREEDGRRKIQNDSIDSI
jgi:hypothetical protein